MLEDDPDDRFITESTLRELGYDIPVHFVNTSTELFNFLGSSARPTLILIDYNSTPMNALDVLKRLKSQEAWAGIPVVVLADSSVPRYVEECYRHGASTFIKKPSTQQGTSEKINSFFHYWLSTAEA